MRAKSNYYTGADAFPLSDNSQMKANLKRTVKTEETEENMFPVLCDARTTPDEGDGMIFISDLTSL